MHVAVKICQDTIEGCEQYKDSCNDTKFYGYLNERCPATCGFCQSFSLIPGRNETGNTYVLLLLDTTLLFISLIYPTYSYFPFSLFFSFVSNTTLRVMVKYDRVGVLYRSRNNIIYKRYIHW